MAYTDQERQELGVDRLSGEDHYRAYVGAPHIYAFLGASCFSLLTSLGMRESDYVLDIGCGSLRVGRLLIPYLLPGRYGAVEPNPHLVEEAVEKELGREILEKKRVTIVHNDQFEFPRLAQPYRFALAHSIWSHASLAQIRSCLTRFREVMADDGMLAATWCPVAPLAGVREYKGDAWVYPGLTYYKPATLRRVAEECGFHCYDLQWNSFILQQVWSVFTKTPLEIPESPQRKWNPPPHQLANPGGHLLYRLLVRLGLARLDGWPGSGD